MYAGTNIIGLLESECFPIGKLPIPIWSSSFPLAYKQFAEDRSHNHTLYTYRTQGDLDLLVIY